MKKTTSKRFRFEAKSSPPRGVPEDEWALALAIHAAKARDLRWCEGEFFEDADYNTCAPGDAVYACALGALQLAGVRFGRHRKGEVYTVAETSIYHGNDWPMHEPDEDRDEFDPGAFAIGSGYADALGGGNN